MEGVTAAIVAFLFVCIVFPTIVKNKPQYYAAFAAIVAVILLGGLMAVIHSGAFIAFGVFMTAVLQVAAMILLVLSAGGLTFRQFAGEVSEAIEVIRRGETQKEVIIPLSGQQAPRPLASELKSPAATPKDINSGVPPQ
jgi:hypothetical protein